MSDITKIFTKLGVIPILVLLFIVLSFVSPHFLQVSNIINILQQVSITTIIGVGMTFVILTGGIDLSVGSIVALSGLTMAVTHKYFSAMNLGSVNQVLLGIVAPIILSLVVAICMGAINGVMISVGKVPAFIMTFGMMNMARGGAYIISNSNTISVFPDVIRFLGNGKVIGIIPIPIIIAVVLVVIAAWVLDYTKFGRYVYSLGSNREALRLSGINVHKVEIAVYVICSIVCAIGALILIGKLNVSQPVAGAGYEMDAIAAVIIGGTSIYGGEGKVTGTFIGALLVGTIRNGLNLLNVPSSIQPVVIGAAIVAAVFYDKMKSNNLNAKVNKAKP